MEDRRRVFTGGSGLRRGAEKMAPTSSSRKRLRRKGSRRSSAPTLSSRSWQSSAVQRSGAWGSKYDGTVGGREGRRDARSE
jgi:hypothetical protein